MAGGIQENEDKRSPESAEHGDETNNQSCDDGGWDQVAEGAGSQEPREGVSLHGLEDVFLGYVEYFRVVASILFNCRGDVGGDGVGQGNLAFGAGQKKGVQDLLGRCSNIVSRDGVLWRVRIGGESLGTQLGTSSRSTFLTALWGIV